MTRLTASTACVYFLLPVFFGSCATILNGPAQNVHIASSPQIRVVSVDNCVLVDSDAMVNPKTFVVPRRKKDLVVHLQLDSVVKTIMLRPQNSFAFWFNIYMTYGVGMLADKDNPKRYGYPGWNYFSMKDNIIRRERFEPIPKGTWRFAGTLPVISSYNMRLPVGHYLSGGVLALEAGVEYFYKDDRYFSLNAGTGTDRGAEHIGRFYYDYSNAGYASFRNNYVVGSFDLGYGLSLSNMQWRRVSNGDSTVKDALSNSTVLGLSLSAQYRFGQYFRMGFLYQPGLLSTNFSPAFDYQHIFSLQLTWKFPLNPQRHE
ncbi:MAG TPA: hypothetical protein VGM41_19875 [Chitinophagaceae bacterium]